MMAFGDGLSGQPSSDHSGVTFQYELRKSWNTPKSFVDLDSLGVVVLDTTVVPDVLGLNTYRDNAELVRVLPGASPNIIQILVPDDLVEPRGFHNILLEDMTAMIVRPVSAGNLTALKPFWPQSLLTDMSKRQVDMETQHRFSGLRYGSCLIVGGTLSLVCFVML